jgi:uncharacterized protein involved in outer membrane biogenesis
LGGQKEKKEAEEEKRKKEQAEEGKPPPALLVSLVDVDSGQIQYADRSQGIDFRANQNIRGAINMDLDLTGASKDGNAIQNALKGKAKAEVINGALVDINLAESVLSGATGVPGAANLVPAEVKNKYPAIFSSKIRNSRLGNHQ